MVQRNKVSFSLTAAHPSAYPKCMCRKANIDIYYLCHRWLRCAAHPNGKCPVRNLLQRTQHTAHTRAVHSSQDILSKIFIDFSAISESPNLHHRCHHQIPLRSHCAVSIEDSPESSSAKCRKMHHDSIRKFGPHICKWWNCPRTSRSYKSTRRTSASMTISRQSVSWVCELWNATIAIEDVLNYSNLIIITLLLSHLEGRSYPPANISWFINGNQVSSNWFLVPVECRSM